MTAEQFDDGHVIVTIGGAGSGHRLVDALQQRGIDAIGVNTTAGDSRADLAALFTLAGSGSSPLRAVVHTNVEPTALRPAPLTELGDAEWDQRCEAQILHAIHVFQAAFDTFGCHAADTAGTGSVMRRIVAVVPTVAVHGAPELVPLAATGEGIRALVRCTARQWGTNGITLNNVAVPVSSLADDAPAGPTVAAPSLPPGDALDDLTAAVSALLGPAGAVMTGQTLVADRGTVMV